MRFALRLPWRPSEPAHGYLLRVATRYASSPGRLASRFGIDERGLTRGSGLERLARLGGVDAAPMAAASPTVRARERRVDLVGETLLLSDWSMATRRWCPRCLAADDAEGRFAAYQRYWWDVGSVAVCPQHGVTMLDRCQACGRGTTWTDRSLRRCACGAAFADAPPDAHRHDPTFSRYVARRIGAPASAISSTRADAVPLFQLPRLTTRVGTALTGEWSASPPLLSAAGVEDVRGEGLTVLDDPEQAFMAALDATLTGRDGRPAGLIGAYGWIYSHWLCFPDQDPTGVFAPLLRGHAVANHVVSVEEPILGAAGSGGLTLTGLADHLGQGFERTRAMVAAHGALGQTARRGVASPVAPAAVRAIVDARANDMLVRDACATLGVGKRILGELAEAGMLRRSAGGRYDRAEVERFAARLLKGGAPVGRLVSLTGLARSGAGSVAELCGDVVAGRLRAAPLTRRPRRLDEVGLSSEQVATRRPGPPLTHRAIARRLGLREDVTRYLAGTGVLSDDASPRPTLGGLGLFERDFVTTVELSRRCCVSARRVWLALEDLGVMPVFGPPDCRQLIYRRQDAEKALAAYLLARGHVATIVASATH